ncbi:hypothetical protein, partial [Lactococcus petauri]|uniref:hypothetical protein n=1 Tax=Lactococcus petauri TaxID=1940789 RepID=UPI0021F182EF
MTTAATPEEDDLEDIPGMQDPDPTEGRGENADVPSTLVPRAAGFSQAAPLPALPDVQLPGEERQAVAQGRAKTA